MSFKIRKERRHAETCCRRRERWTRAPAGSRLHCSLGLTQSAKQHADMLVSVSVLVLPSMLWRCWLGGKKGIRPVKKLEWWGYWHGHLSGARCSCIWPSWCHCHSLSLASVKSRLVLPFWYLLTQVVPEKEPLNGCVCVYPGAWFTKYLTIILRLSYDNAKVAIVLRPASNL